MWYLKLLFSAHYVINPNLKKVGARFVVLDVILLPCFSDSDCGVCLYRYWGLELVNRPRYTKGMYSSAFSSKILRYFCFLQHLYQKLEGSYELLLFAFSSKVADMYFYFLDILYQELKDSCGHSLLCPVGSEGVGKIICGHCSYYH